MVQWGQQYVYDFISGDDTIRSPNIRNKVFWKFNHFIGTTTISELEMERTLEELEKQSWDKINVALKNNEAQEEQDDSVICDVCRSVSSFENL